MTPKILAVLKSIALGDEKLGHSLISVGYSILRSNQISINKTLNHFQLAVKAMGRFLCLIFEDYNKKSATPVVRIEDFKALIRSNANAKSSDTKDSSILSKLRAICLS